MGVSAKKRKGMKAVPLERRGERRFVSMMMMLLFITMVCMW